jgi:signal peptidase II
VALDQASKYMVETAVPLNRHVEVIPGYLDIVHVRNPGAAFGILSQSAWDWRKTFFVSVSGYRPGRDTLAGSFWSDS